MLRSAVVILIFATLAAARSPRFRVVNGQQIGTVVNGEVVNPGTFPYIVYLPIKRLHEVGPNGEMEMVRSQCAGTIIHEYAVLTAAHCMDGAKPYDVIIVAGVLVLNMPQKSVQSVQSRRAELYVKHEKYHEKAPNDNTTSQYDIAIVFVSLPFTFNKYVGKLDLAQPADYKIGMTAVGAGWGINVNGTFTPWLNAAEMTLVNSSVCQKIDPTDYTSLLCLMDLAGRTTLCSGDSGGPLVKDNVLIGVLNSGTLAIGSGGSPGNGSCDPRFGATYTNVSSFRPWIDTKLSWYEEFLRSN